MSRYWPHTSYADDQPHAKGILSLHVVTRGFTTGAILGGAFTAAHQLIRGPSSSSPFTMRLVFNSARGALLLTPLAFIGMDRRMSGREPIEWQDRSWRLLESRGQMETDDWTYAGMAAGPPVWLAMGMGRGLPGLTLATGLVGASALGSVGGTIGYMVWRYGVNGGRFPERKDMVSA